MTFESMKLMPQILQNVERSGYTVPTPIQAATIPLVLSGRDVLGCAQTGTGKTAAFALPMIQNLALTPRRRTDARVIRALILTPTRELAQQIYENFVQYGKRLPVSPCVIFGGVGQQAQVDAIHRGADIVIACPGRLWDLMGQGYIRLDWVETFVLDEADRMLDMGFIHDVRRIAEKLPPKHQTLLFSATMPAEVEKLAMDLLHDPESVKVDPVSSPVQAIDQCLYYVDKANKKNLLAKLLKSPDVENALVFSRTKHGADRIVRELSRAGIDACAIHGDKSQNARQAALTSFKDGSCKVLVATDIAARGIDIAGLSHVINYDQPMEPEAYVHRIGRTGRAGHTGKAISFCCIDEMKQLGQVEKLIGKRLRVEESDWPMEVMTPSEPKPRQPRPAKLTSRGNAVPEQRLHQSRPAKLTTRGNAVPEATPRQSRPAKLTTQGNAVPERKHFGPAAVSPARKPMGRTSAPILIGRDGRRINDSAAQSSPREDRPKTASAPRTTGRPVQRVNQQKPGHGPSGKRG